MAFIYDLADTWNDAGTTFTAIKMDVTDTASASDSKLLDLQVGGVSIFSVGTGAVTRGLIKLSDRSTISTTNGPWFNTGTAEIAGFGGYNLGIPGLALNKSSGLNWTSANSINSQSVDLILARDAAGTLAQRYGTNAQTFNLYNTYTDASNYQRASFTQTATGLVLDAQYAGTGTEPNNIFELKSGGSSKFAVDKNGDLKKGGITLLGYGITDTFTVEVPDSGFRAGTSAGKIYVGNGGLKVSSLNFGSTGLPTRTSTVDLTLTRDAAHTLAQRRSTNAQTFNLYNTYTDGSNYERASFTQTATGLVLDAQYAGTGTEPDNILELKSGGVSKFKVTKIGSINSPSLSASLISGSHHRVYAGFTTRGNIYLDAGSDTVGFQGPMIIGGTTANTTAPRLQADGNHTLAQRNTTNAQESRLYGTYTSATDYQRLSTKTIKEAVTTASGASVTTTISIPKYSQLIGVTTRVTTDLGNSNGTTGYTVGDGSDADLWGDITGITAGTTSDAADFTAVAALGAGTADRTITLTATGGNFDGTGVIEVCAFYLRAEAD